ncbi:MAG: Rrf2 family transcriptional regulator [Bacteriovoracaceae bacterium]|nr:Rrf2 family transcriptional regulator [Bacteriovoracaceae bacterium]
MLKISKKVGYALMAIKYMLEKESNTLVSAREICDHLQIPFDTLAKVMQALNKSKVLISVQGVSGGYQVTDKIYELSMATLAKIVEKKTEKACKDCDCCDISDTCNVKMPMNQFSKIMQQTLEKIMVKDLLAQDIDLEA